MVKSRIFDNKQLLKEHPEIPHYKEEVVCFMSEYKDRSYPENERYFNRELYMILVLEGSFRDFVEWGIYCDRA